MFGVGLPEMAVIALVAVLVFGPDRMPELARQAARFLRQVRTMANSARDDIRSELGPEFADLELRDLDPRAIVRKQITEAMSDLEAEEREALQTPEGRARAAGQRPLIEGEPPPYDVDAT